MTRITRIDIEGFKGIQSLSIEPTAINVITGRNNTGKTSLLEAIGLAFDPTTLKNFDENIDTLVNVEHKKAVISYKINGDEKILEVYKPDKSRAHEVLVEALLKPVSDFIKWTKKHGDIDDEELESIEEDLRTIVEDNITPEVIEEATTQIVILAINNTEYPYLYPGGVAQELFQNIGADLQNQLFDEADTAEYDDQTTLTTFTSNIPFRIWAGGDFDFIEEVPPVSDALTTIGIKDLTDRPETENGELDAVKIDDIEDFLIEKDIIENLRNFDLDYLVFEDENGEKYSVPYDFMGDGFKAIIGILWELLDEETTGDIILLEEPAIHMHPGYVRELVYFLVEITREKEIQLFITTHNNDFVVDFFTENISTGESSFLKKEFTLVQMQADTADVMSYDEAEEHLKELHLDLRGI